ncbi:ImmA/IrrE family metallo-endopeptidase [Mycolicibacterium elephantis]|uniref:IrrE N-terminal-like domain-containing protein n=1 Tax=Mycolicibacterium elephantis DSM 44368 TaxID=1335622 RepID=A0A439DXV7_9MYCO|nr:ImmA/IrrE family metallo-endopeptidase [Mycolicibacterium elephantis]MCV7222966.1 hypothetical protein [Mycolicibacterium elephantis]RWA22318.1 hypothetical protein MELE44368_12965 [Mycolicibacterium elephantis DSM 44368]
MRTKTEELALLTSATLAGWDDNAPPPWNPWAYLEAYHPDVLVTDAYRLPDHSMGLHLGRKIWLCRKLNQAERRSTLAHEIVHIERGPVPSDPAMAAAEERVVDEIASRRLIRTEDLGRIAARYARQASRAWARHLWVDVPMLHARLTTLDAVERKELAGLGVDVLQLKRRERRLGRILAGLAI